MNKIDIIKNNNDINNLLLDNNDIKDSVFINYSLIYNKLLNNDIYKYPPNKDIMNYYIYNALLKLIIDKKNICVLPIATNYNDIKDSVSNIIKELNVSYNINII